MQAVGQLDNNNPNIFSHGHEKLTQAFHVPFDAAIFDFPQLSYAFDEEKDIVAEFFSNLGGGHWRIFQGVVNEAGNNHVRRDFKLGQDFRHLKGVSGVGLAGKTGLALMRFFAKFQSFVDFLFVFLRQLFHLLEDLLRVELFGEKIEHGYMVAEEEKIRNPKHDLRKSTKHEIRSTKQMESKL